jgi:hypothetical protein
MRYPMIPSIRRISPDIDAQIIAPVVGIINIPL